MVGGEAGQRRMRRAVRVIYVSSGKIWILVFSPNSHKIQLESQICLLECCIDTPLKISFFLVFSESRSTGGAGYTAV